MFKNQIQKLLAICVLVILLTLGITITALAADDQGLTFGMELDALPYISGGHYISGVIGYDHYNLRLITTHTSIPSFVTPKGYKNWDMDVNAVIVDYFPDESREGLWLGGGIEFWDSKIKNKNTNDSGKFSQKILTVGCGYVYKMTEHWYVNPWAALHYNLGDESVAIGTGNMKLQDAMYEASIKLGYQF
jgi:hypothetical protein